MTSVLYTSGMNRPILPEAVRPGKHYSLRADLKLNAWALVAVAVAFASRWWLQQHRDWALPLQSVIALAPLAPSLFYVQSIARWIGGMDELQRRIQLEAVAFSFLATCLITLTWAFQQNAGLPRFDVSWVAPLLIALWGLGLGIAKRRYE